MDKIEELAEIFKALSDPTRLRVVKLLAEQEGALCVNALAHKLHVTQSAISQHLRILRQAGLVESDRRGYHVHYFLSQKGLAQYKTRLQEILGEDFAAK